MTDAPQQTPRPRKLRSSCDSCGAAKLKCDRGRPQCGRCVSLELKCVYGVSRKMGKPPREKLNIPAMPSRSHAQGEPSGSIQQDKTEDEGGNRCNSAFINDGIAFSSGPYEGRNSAQSTSVESYCHNLMAGANTPETMSTDLFRSSLPDLTSLDFGDALLSNHLETGPIPAMQSSEIDSCSNTAAHANVSQINVDEGLLINDILVPPSESSSHDCCREAYDVLGKLSFLQQNETEPFPRAAQGTASASEQTGRCVPFDQILRLNRESRDRLGQLLTCPCAKSPHLALLYASIIALVLRLYQEAVGCTQGEGWSPPDASADMVRRSASCSESISGLQSPWSNTTAGGMSTPALAGAAAHGVAPAQMAMGSFNIDDQQVQTALTIQLLLGEIRRTGSLIESFSSRSSEDIDDFSFSSVNGLYKSLAHG